MWCYRYLPRPHKYCRSGESREMNWVVSDTVQSYTQTVHFSAHSCHVLFPEDKGHFLFLCTPTLRYSSPLYPLHITLKLFWCLLPGLQASPEQRQYFPHLCSSDAQPVLGIEQASVNVKLIIGKFLGGG